MAKAVMMSALDRGVDIGDPEALAVPRQSPHPRHRRRDGQARSPVAGRELLVPRSRRHGRGRRLAAGGASYGRRARAAAGMGPVERRASRHSRTSRRAVGCDRGAPPIGYQRLPFVPLPAATRWRAVARLGLFSRMGRTARSRERCVPADEARKMIRCHQGMLIDIQCSRQQTSLSWRF